MEAILKIMTFLLWDFVTLSAYDLLCHIEFKSIGKTLICWISHKLQPLTDYGGHLGRQLENNLFPIVGFLGIFNMLILTPNTTKNRWNTFCSNLLGVRHFFYGRLTRLFILIGQNYALHNNYGRQRQANNLDYGK